MNLMNVMSVFKPISSMFSTAFIKNIASYYHLEMIWYAILMLIFFFPMIRTMFVIYFGIQPYVLSNLRI